MKRNIALGVGLLVVALLAAPVAKADGIFTATLLGANEVGPVASPATGFAALTLAGNMVNLSVNFSGLLSPVTAATLHCCVGPGVNTGVAWPVLPGFPNATSGTYTNNFDLTLTGTYMAAFLTANGGTAAGAEAALVAALSAGNVYLNIHDALFPGGEIRGQFAAVSTPEPGMLVLLGTGLLGLVGAARRKCLT